MRVPESCRIPSTKLPPPQQRWGHRPSSPTLTPRPAWCRAAAPLHTVRHTRPTGQRVQPGGDQCVTACHCTAPEVLCRQGAACLGGLGHGLGAPALPEYDSRPLAGVQGAGGGAATPLYRPPWRRLARQSRMHTTTWTTSSCASRSATTGRCSPLTFGSAEDEAALGCVSSAPQAGCTHTTVIKSPGTSLRQDTGCVKPSCDHAPRQAGKPRLKRFAQAQPPVSALHGSRHPTLKTNSPPGRGDVYSVPRSSHAKAWRGVPGKVGASNKGR